MTSQSPIHYIVEGVGPPVVLIHGVGADLSSWDQVVPFLARSRTVLRLDLRGHGKSPALRPPFTLEGFSDDIVAMLDREGIAQADIVGFSLGGLIAQSVALDHPDRVDRLALLATVAGRTDEERQRVASRHAVILRDGIAAVTGGARERWFTEEFAAAHPERVEARIRSLVGNDVQSYAEAYRIFGSGDLADRLHDIRHETLVLTGEQDSGSSPRMSRLIHERIENSRLVILPRLKHSLLVEAPDIIAAHLVAFLDSAPQPSLGLSA